MFISHLPLSCLKKYSCEKGKLFIVKRTYVHVHENENKTMHFKKLLQYPCGRHHCSFTCSLITRLGIQTQLSNKRVCIWN